MRQRIPFMTVRGKGEVPAALKDYYARKSLNMVEDVEGPIRAYLDDDGTFDDQHRRLVFGWQDAELETKSGQERREWLLKYAQSDPYWRPSKAKGP